MTTRRHYLVCYDISDDSCRDKVFHHLEGCGDHAQFSVFFCQLNPRELAELQSTLSHIINHQTDQVLLIDLGPAYHPLNGGIESLGKPLQPRALAVVI